MSRDDIQKLLGGYATGTLTPEEQQALFEAALTDQELFDALAREEPLRDTLSDPAARAQLLAALDEAPAPWYRAWWRPMLVTAAVLSVVVGVAIWQRSPGPAPVSVAKVELPRFQPRAETASAPVLPPPPEVKQSMPAYKELPSPAAAPAPPPPPPTFPQTGVIGGLAPVPMMQQAQQSQQFRQQFAPATGVPLRGTVTDATGAVIPSATVAVQSAATGETVRTLTDDRGEFAAQGSPGDRYQVSVSAPGFRMQTLDGVVPASGAPAPVNVQLQPSASAETVEVTSANSAIAPMQAGTRSVAGVGGGGGGRGGRGVPATFGRVMSAKAAAPPPAMQWRLLRNIPGGNPVNVFAGTILPKDSSLTLRITPVADSSMRIVVGDTTIAADVKQGVPSDTVLPVFDKTGRVEIQVFFSGGTEDKKESTPSITIPLIIR